MYIFISMNVCVYVCSCECKCVFEWVILYRRVEQRFPEPLEGCTCRSVPGYIMTSNCSLFVHEFDAEGAGMRSCTGLVLYYYG